MSAWRKALNGIDALALLLAAGLIGWALAGGIERYRSGPGVAWLERAYGPDRNTQGYEEQIIRNFFNDRRGGYFVDVGASHHQIRSTTYYLEKSLGWRGLAIDPITRYAAGYQKERPKTKFLSLFVSDVSDRVIDFYVLREFERQSTGVKSFVGDRAHDTIQVPTVTLNALLDAEGVSRIDFLSMDIEMAEPQALAGFDLNRFRPELVCIEAHEPVREQVIAYFAKHGYQRIEKYAPLDELNYYYTPRDLHPAGQ